jgi:hypothetical protein
LPLPFHIQNQQEKQNWQFISLHEGGLAFLKIRPLTRFVHVEVETAVLAFAV